ncbi:MAG: hypothetical protein KTR31_17085 [Myxococcales bacterium]|nr:hypothetical protein [Myxococcales bacterium]
MQSVDEALAAFGPDALCARLVASVLAEIPRAPAWVHYGSVAEAAEIHRRSVDPTQLAAALARARTEVSTSLLQVGQQLDVADRHRDLGFLGRHDVDAQTDDAAMKAAALGWFASRCGGASSFVELPAGRSMLAWWAAVEVALPLGERRVEALLAERSQGQMNRLAALVGDHTLQGAYPAMRALTPMLQKVVDLACGRSEDLVVATAPFVLGLVDHTPSAPLDVAARADRMPVWTLLAARLAAERAVGAC